MPTRFSPSLSGSRRNRLNFGDAGRVQQSPSHQHGPQTIKNEFNFTLCSHGAKCGTVTRAMSSSGCAAMVLTLILAGDDGKLL
jgi:hypothetical protein